MTETHDTPRCEACLEPGDLPHRSYCEELDPPILAITVGDLLPGDVCYDLGAGAVEHFTVRSVQLLGPVVIVDFADSTSTAPIPAGVPIRVRRS